MGKAYAEVLRKLTDSSLEHDYEPRRRFAWPESLAADQWLMPPDLMSVGDTPLPASLDGRTLKALSRWESMNFYSLTLHGERELVMLLSRHIHSGGFEAPSDFFHRFIAEENHHMWFFAEFCRRYGKVYPDATVWVSPDDLRPEVDVFLAFLRILIFEEIGDYFNIRMSGDMSLPPIVRELNTVHHADESRHIAAGRQVVRHLWSLLGGGLSSEERAVFETQLKEYIAFTIQSFYNPRMYADAGIGDCYGFRRDLLRQPARRRRHGIFLARSLAFLRTTGIVQETESLY